ncbi:metallopeptidase family protein [Tessaracoccus rhinocerotis]|uniref:Metallopeptidase family protein n=1 Tax=Tessaracoccus rhinocerotis TaxID=1689449 RepID=A0A553K2T2_9ACTN|nr:metallopeptidase family protein [Tessaracoccus rhinocerotis]TRY19019.1 metallopeptidase family protein [Tessaracoccus rhinocerotis]
MDLPEERFDELVDEALGNLPPELLDGLDNVVIVSQDEPDDGSETLGWYEGTALTERDTSYGLGQLPDRVVLFRGPLTRMCEDEDDLLDELEITLLHELGHYHGIDEERLHALGWG